MKIPLSYFFTRLNVTGARDGSESTEIQWIMRFIGFLCFRLQSEIYRSIKVT